MHCNALQIDQEMHKLTPDCLAYILGERGQQFWLGLPEGKFPQIQISVRLQLRSRLGSYSGEIVHSGRLEQGFINP